MILVHIKKNKHQSQQIRILYKTNKKNGFSELSLLESMFIYCICTQYLVGAPFALITVSIRRGMEVISLWHCRGGVEAQVSLTVAFSSSAFFGPLFVIFLLTIPHRFSVFRSGEFAGQSSTPTPWSFNQLLVLLAVWAGAKSCWKMKSASLKKLVSRRKHEVLQHFLVNGCSDVGFQKTQWTNTRWHCTPNHHWLWNLTLDFKQLVLWASPPFLQTLGPWFPNEIQNLLSSEKRTLDHWATVQFFFFLAQVRRLWRQLYPNSSTRLCVVLLMPWPQPQSIPCEVHTNSWIEFAWQSS